MQNDNFIPIHCEVAEALAKINLSPYESRVLWILFRKTYGFIDPVTGLRKKDDYIAYSQFTELTGLPKSHISRALKGLEKKGLLSRNSKRIGFGKEFMKKLPEMVTIQEMVTNNGNKKLPVEAQKLPVEVTKVTSRGSKVTSRGTTKETIQKKIYTKETIQKKNEFEYLKDSTFLSTFNDYLTMRQKIHRPATERAKELAFKELHKYDLKTAIAMLEQSIFNSWQGIFPLKRKEQRDGKDKRYIPESLRENQEERRKQLEQGTRIVSD